MPMADGRYHITPDGKLERIGDLPPEGKAGQTLPSLPPKRKQPYQVKDIRIGASPSVTLENPNLPQPSSKGKWEQEDHMINQAYDLLNDQIDIYDKGIKSRLPKLGEGAAQGLAYSEPNLAQKWFPKSYQLDPVVQDWADKFGALSNLINKIYASGRPSALGYNIYTKPHIPVPPAHGVMGAWESYQDFNFDQYRKQLESARQVMGYMSGKIKPKAHEELPPDAVPGSTPGLWYIPSKNKWIKWLP